MKNIILFSVLLTMSIPTYSQPTSRKAYFALIDTGGINKVKGILCDIQDSTLILFVNYTYTNISYRNIKGIGIRKKGSPGEGAVIGAVLGGLTAGIISFVASGGLSDGETGSSNNYTNSSGWYSGMSIGPSGGALIVGVAALGIVPGTLVGAIAGTAFKKNIFIGRDLARFQQQADIICSYSLAGIPSSNTQ